MYRLKKNHLYIHCCNVVHILEVDFDMIFLRATLVELYCFRLVRPSIRPSAVVVTLVIFNRISLKFHIRIASIKLLLSFEYGFCPTNDNQDGRQNGRHLSVCILWSLLFHLIGFFQISYVDCFYQTLAQI